MSGDTRMEHVAYEPVSKQGKRVVIPTLDVEVCDHCGERVLALAAVQPIEVHKRYCGRLLLHLDLGRHRG